MFGGIGLEGFGTLEIPGGYCHGTLVFDSSGGGSGVDSGLFGGDSLVVFLLVGGAVGRILAILVVAGNQRLARSVRLLRQRVDVSEVAQNRTSGR